MPMTVAAVMLDIEGGVATISLNRPDVGNAVNLMLAQGLLEAAMRCDQDDAIRCVVLTGRGKLFCGGGDLGDFAAAADQIPAFLGELAGTLHRALALLMRMKKPLLVLVNGPAAGAGLSLAIAGDIVLAARSAHFTAAYGSIGLSPDGGMSWHLPRLVGMRRAQEMIIGNRRVPADEAERIGLVTRTVDDADLAAEGARQAALLAASPTAAIGAARTLLLDSFDGPFEGQLDRETRSIAASGGTAECREGIAAFVARRKPDFQGVS
jgi:2-(1,2-epoxy-1,2-dihydrophenyl)acetyl-CoA isomerase